MACVSEQPVGSCGRSKVTRARRFFDRFALTCSWLLLPLFEVASSCWIQLSPEAWYVCSPGSTQPVVPERVGDAQSDEVV